MCFWTHFVGLMGYLTIIELVWAGKDAVLPQIFPYLTVLATPSGTHISSNFFLYMVLPTFVKCI